MEKLWRKQQEEALRKKSEEEATQDTAKCRQDIQAKREPPADGWWFPVYTKEDLEAAIRSIEHLTDVTSLCRDEAGILDLLGRFGKWREMWEAGKLSGDMELYALAERLKEELMKCQETAFPVIRAAFIRSKNRVFIIYVDNLGRIGGNNKEEIVFDITGFRNEYARFTWQGFSSDLNKEAFGDRIRTIFKLLRFKQVELRASRVTTDTFIMEPFKGTDRDLLLF